MKYRDFHRHRPEPNTPVYFICPKGFEVLGWFKGGTWFEDMDKKYQNYSAKYWRELTEQEMLLVQLPQTQEVRTKRKYTRRNTDNNSD